MSSDDAPRGKTTLASLTIDGSEAEAQGDASRPYVVILHGDSPRMVRLPESGAVLIGRSRECDLQIDDPHVSRQHARLETADGDATLVDLESRRGILVNSEPVTGTRVLLTGDLVSIGSATLLYHGGERTPALANVLEFPRFRDRLREELERATDYGRPFAVACVDLGAAVERRRVVAAIGRLLRRMDALAWAGESQLFLVLPESDAADARTIAARLLEAMKGLAPGARVGHAHCPQGTSDADDLLADARHAALAAAPGCALPATRELRRIAVGPHEVVLADAAMSRIYALLERLAGFKLPVLISGETGTGKELAARALHEGSPRRTSRFAAINCAALPESLLESELFGHERGAFSGAVQAKPGILEDASGGTVFLDEIGELPLAAQAKLLRVLETGQVTRIGELRERAIDVRLVAATHRNLPEEVRAGRFRQDLYFRLNGAQVRLPALRERPAEIPLFAQLFLDAARERAGVPRLSLSPAAMDLLVAQRWPGNVRELKNLMEYVAATCAEPVVEPWHLEPGLAEGADGGEPAAELPSADRGSFRPLAEEMRELEHRRVSEALAATDGNQARAAALLAVPLRTFYDKVKALGLSPRRKPQ